MNRFWYKLLWLLPKRIYYYQYKNAFLKIKLSITSKVIKGQNKNLKVIFFCDIFLSRSTLWRHKFLMKWPLCQSHSSTFLYGPILMKIWMNAFTINTLFWDFFTLIPSDLKTTLTYVLLDNFCSCFINTSVPHKKISEL